jgi:serine/threonine protein kinase
MKPRPEWSRARMPPPAKNEEFLELIQKSGVVEAARVKSYVQKLNESAAQPAKPEELAEAMVRDGVLTYFQAEQLLQGKWKRFFIGKYKVLERIGTGGMGQVFLCEHKLMKRRVALKVLPAAKAQDPASLERFYREAKAVAALDHPNIVRAYDIDQDENIHFLVMEFVDGPNLQELVKKIGPLDPTRACHYIFGATVGLQHAHEMGLVHRDIKPGNVLVDRTGVIKVLDMGLARFFHDEDDQLTKKYDENVLGTADYLAPEQALDSHSVDIRADIYSLGGTFYYLLTGSPPFPEGTIAQKLLWHQTRETRPIRSIRPDVPEALASIIETMMRKDPARRYQTPADVLTALAPWVQTPIAPPTEQEIPAISAAAGRQLNVPRSVADIRRSSVIGSLPGLPSGARQTTSGLPGTAPHPALFAGTAVATAPNPSADAWAKLASDTQPKALGDTARNPALKSNPFAVADSKSGKPWLLMTLIGLLMCCGMAAAALLYSRMTASPGETGKRKLYVTKGAKSPNPNQTFATLRAAIAAATPGSIISILDDQLDEPAIPTIIGKGKDGPADCTIEAASNSKHCVWHVASTAGSAPASALEFQNVQGIRILGLTIDCRGVTEFGVSVLGVCPGLTLDRVTVANPNTAGIRLNNSGGDPVNPIRFGHVRVAAGAKQPLVAGILFTAQATMPNKFIFVNSCRLDGPGTDAIRVAGPVQDVEMTGNRIGNWSNGLTFSSGMPSDAICKLTFASNTLFQLSESAVRCETPMPTGVKGDVVIRQNLFLQCRELSRGPYGAIPGLISQDNARDGVSGDGKGLLTGVLTVNGTIGTDPNQDDHWLRYESSSPFAAVGPNKKPVGAGGD